MMRKLLTDVYQTAWVMDPDGLTLYARIVRTFTVQPHWPSARRAALVRVWRNWSLFIGSWTAASLTMLAGYAMAAVVTAVLTAPFGAESSAEASPGASALGGRSSSELGPSPQATPSPIDDSARQDSRDDDSPLKLVANKPSPTESDECSCASDPAEPIVAPSQAPTTRPTPSATTDPTPTPDPTVTQPGNGTDQPDGGTSSPTDPGDGASDPGSDPTPNDGNPPPAGSGGQGGGVGLDVGVTVGPSVDVTVEVTTETVE